MGDDEYHPLEQSGSNLTKAGGIGYMVVDVIDSLQIMGLDDEYSRARAWVAEKLSFERDDDFSTFEVCVSSTQSLHTFGFIFFTLDDDQSTRRPSFRVSSFRRRPFVSREGDRPGR
jgi:hypothetical protein